MDIGMDRGVYPQRAADDISKATKDVDSIIEMIVAAKGEYEKAKQPWRKVEIGKKMSGLIYLLDYCVKKIVIDSFNLSNHKLNKYPFGYYVALKAAIYAFADILQEVDIKQAYIDDLTDRCNCLLLRREGDKLYRRRTSEAMNKIGRYLKGIRSVCEECHMRKLPKVDHIKLDEKDEVQKNVWKSIQAVKTLHRSIVYYTKAAEGYEKLPKAKDWFKENACELSKCLWETTKSARRDKSGGHRVEYRTAKAFHDYLKKVECSNLLLNEDGAKKTFVQLADELRILSLVLYALRFA